MCNRLLLEACIRKELRKLDRMHHSVWRVLARAVSMAWQELRHCTLTLANISASFFTYGTLRKARQWPWRLLSGDVRKNLEFLMKLPHAPRDPLTGKIYDMLVGGEWTVPQVMKGLEPLGLLGWTSNGAEQVHGSSAVMRKSHPDYSLDMHLARAFFHSLRTLWAAPEPDRSQKRANRKQRKIDRQKARRAQKAGPSAYVFKATFDAAKEGTSTRQAWNSRTDLMTKATKEQLSMPEEDKAAVRRAVPSFRRAIRDSIAEKIEALVKERDRLQKDDRERARIRIFVQQLIPGPGLLRL